MLLVAVAGEAGAGMDEPIIHGHEANEPSAAQFLLASTEGGIWSRRNGTVAG